MSSPFSSFQEFSEADGPIYTYANNPAVISFLLLICLGITVYFIYASYTIKQETKPQNPASLSLLILAGAASLVSAVLHPAPNKPPEDVRRSPQAEFAAKNWQSLALLGLVGIGSTAGRKTNRSPRQRRRSGRAANRSPRW